MMDLEVFDLLKNMWSQLADVFPSFVGALLFFFIGWILAKLVSIGIRKLLVKIKVDKIGEKLNEIDFISKSPIDIRFSEVISKIIYYIIMLVVLMVSAEILNIGVLTELLQDLFDYLPNILVACVILIIGLLVAESVRKIIRSTATSLGIPSASLISSFVFYFLLINILISALSQAKIETDFISQNLSLIIGGFVLAFAIGYGLASRSTVSNYLASFYTKSQVKVGDRISIHGRVGRVVQINKSSLILYTEEETELIIPLNQTSSTLIEILTPSEEIVAE